MAKRKAAKNQSTKGNTTGQDVEPMVIALAEQLGSFLGRVQKKADGWLENEALVSQVSQIRDGAAALLIQVNRAGAVVSKSAAAAKLAASKRRDEVSKALAAPKRRGREGEKAKAKASKGRGAAADAPAKRLRKPPPQELFDPRLGEPMGKQMGQKSLKRRGRG